MSEDIQMIYEVVREIREILKQIRDRILVREEVKTIKAEELPIEEETEIIVPILPKSQMRYNSKEKTWEIKGWITLMTDKAFCIQFEGLKDAEATWFPRSTVKAKQEQINLPQWIQIQTWILKKKNLLKEGK